MVSTAAEIEIPVKKSSVKVFSATLLKLWNRLINIGVTTQTSDFDKKRTRLLNGICSWGFAIYLWHTIAYLNDKDAWISLCECIAGLFVTMLPVLLNYYRKHDLACHLFNILNLFLYLFDSVSQGGRDGVQYIFVPSAVACMLFFKTGRVVITYFFLNLLFFLLANISFSYHLPIFKFAGQEQQVWANWITMFVILFFIVYYFKTENERQEKQLEKKNEGLLVEKQKSDDLLMNILPYETAEELKHTGVSKSRSFNMVTVMFTDFRNFTEASESLHPEKLVGEIHLYFTMFDQVMSKYNIEKIKTIGDSYMCAGGLPEENTSNPLDVVMAALEIQEFMAQKKLEKEAKGELFFECRLGIHTGPVIAGIVGTKKFAYDIWGDTVNIASRMESGGEVGKVNISGTTYNLIKDQFDCHYRGKIAAKNKGEVDMYFVDAPLVTA